MFDSHAYIADYQGMFSSYLLPIERMISHVHIQRVHYWTDDALVVVSICSFYPSETGLTTLIHFAKW